jgi:hypothetical protein
MKPIEARFSRPHNMSMAVVAAGMVLMAVVYLLSRPEQAPAFSLSDSRFLINAMLGAAMTYYVWLGLTRYANREPQVVIDRDGILLGFGRNRRFAWQDIDGCACAGSASARSCRSASSPRPSSRPISAVDVDLDDGCGRSAACRPPSRCATTGSTRAPRRCLTPCRSFRPNLIRS